MKHIPKRSYINIAGVKYLAVGIDTNRKARIQAKKDKRANVLKSALIIFGITAILTLIASLIMDKEVIQQTNANDIIQEHGRFINRFPLEKTVIGCYNNRTKTTRQAMSCNKGGDHNIKLPGRSQIAIWLKYYTEHQILNRLALVNFESDFNIHAQNKQAKGYVQTLKSHNIAIDIDSQLQWLKNREQTTYGKKYFNGKTGLLKGCASYWNEYNFRDNIPQGEYGVLACMYRYHYDANNGSWYGQRGIKVTKFYKEFLFGIID